MELDYLTIVFLSALSSASIMLIATVGLAVVFGLMGVINLAHGEFLMIGAYAALTATQNGVPYILSILIAVLVTMLIGAVVEVAIIRHLYGRMFDTMLATWGLSFAFYQLAVLMFGTVTPGIGMPEYSIKIGDYSMAGYSLLMLLIAPLMLGLVYVLMTKTSYGMRARAAIQEPEIAKSIGISSSRVNMLTFSVGCGLAGFAGAILLPLVPATPSMGFAFVIKAFLTVVVAGPVALSGTSVVALGLGGGSSLVASFLTSVVGDLFFFLVTAALLWLYPQGISGRWTRRI